MASNKFSYVQWGRVTVNSGVRVLVFVGLLAFRPGVFYAGMEIPYLSEAFFDLAAFTCEQMRTRGMRLWLYDEGGWPSGVADGAVVAENRDYGVWALARRGGQKTLRWKGATNLLDLTSGSVATRNAESHTFPMKAFESGGFDGCRPVMKRIIYYIEAGPSHRGRAACLLPGRQPTM